MNGERACVQHYMRRCGRHRVVLHRVRERLRKKKAARREGESRVARAGAESRKDRVRSHRLREMHPQRRRYDTRGWMVLRRVGRRNVDRPRHARAGVRFPARHERHEPLRFDTQPWERRLGHLINYRNIIKQGCNHAPMHPRIHATHRIRLHYRVVCRKACATEPVRVPA